MGFWPAKLRILCGRLSNLQCRAIASRRHGRPTTPRRASRLAQPADLVGEERVVGDGVFQRRAQLLTHGSRRVGAELFVDHPIDHPLDGGLRADLAGLQLGRQIGGDAAGRGGRVLSRRARRAGGRAGRLQLVGKGRTTLHDGATLVAPGCGGTARRPTGSCDLTCHARATLARQARMLETAALAVSYLARMTLEIVVKRWLSSWICCCKASICMFDVCPSCIIDCTFGAPEVPAPVPAGGRPAGPIPVGSKGPGEPKPAGEPRPPTLPEMEFDAPMRASWTAAAMTGPAITWVATSAPLISNDTPPASTSRNGAGGLSVWRARVASISRRESVGRSVTGLMVGMGSSCRGYRSRDSESFVMAADPFARRGVHSPPWVWSADFWPRFGGAPSSRAIGSGTISSCRSCSTLRSGSRRSSWPGVTGT